MAIAPRAVFVARETDYELLLARHATRDQVRFFLNARGQHLETVEAQHRQFHEVLQQARASVPPEWRSTLVMRTDLDRFLFAAEDIIVAVGQDGLVANVAKYLNGQLVLGINPAPDLYDGVLVRFAPRLVSTMLTRAANGDVPVQHRTMVRALLDDGQEISALNEIFIGHRSHQSARYEIEVNGKHEVQSSSGVIISSGTGATGWARSISESIHERLPLLPEEPAVSFFVREPFPSIATGTSIRFGKMSASDPIRIVSRMNEGGVVFADGLEQDRISFDWGRMAQVSVSTKRLNLVLPP